MTLLNPIMLTGLLALAVPVLIHLLNRAKFQVEPFGGMFFLRQAMQFRASQIKLQNFILLAVRCLLLATIVFALARPVSAPSTAPDPQQPTTHIIILDGSFSMANGEPGTTPFDSALEKIREIVTGIKPNDNLQLIWGGDRPRPLFDKAIYDKPTILETIATLEPGTGSSNIPQAIKQAFWSADISRLPQQQIYIFTDGQAQGWYAGNQRIWQELGEQQAALMTSPKVFVLLQPPQDSVANLAITACEPEFPLNHIHRPAVFRVQIFNNDKQSRNVQVEFNINGKPETIREIKVQPGVNTLSFEHQFDKPGNHFAEAALVEPDNLSIDDRRASAFKVLDTITVLVVSATSQENLWLDDAALAVKALQKSDFTNTGSLFQVDIKPPSYLDMADLKELSGYDCIIIANLSSFSDYTAFTLERFVESGGGLLITAGPNASAASYNFLFKRGTGIIPAELIAHQSRQDRFFEITLIPEKASGLYSMLGLQRPRRLDDTVVVDYWRSRPAPHAVVLGTIDDHPFIVYQKYGRGRTAFWTTSLNAAWTNLPATPHYLPLLQSLISVLASNRMPGDNLKTGEPIILNQLRSLDKQGECDGSIAEITLPNGEIKSVLANDQTELISQWPKTRQPGIYTIAPCNSEEVYHAAVQLDSDESNLTPLRTDEQKMISSFCRLHFHSIPARFMADIQRQSQYIEYWQAAIGIAVILLCLESYLKVRFGQQ